MLQPRTATLPNNQFRLMLRPRPASLPQNQLRLMQPCAATYYCTGTTFLAVAAAAAAAAGHWRLHPALCVCGRRQLVLRIFGEKLNDWRTLYGHCRFFWACLHAVSEGRICR